MCLVLPVAERRGNKAHTAQRRVPPGAKRRGEQVILWFLYISYIHGVGKFYAQEEIPFLSEYLVS